MTQKDHKRGGARPGSGRKPLHRVRRTVAFEPEIDEWLDDKEDKNGYLNEKLKRIMKSEKQQYKRLREDKE